MILSYEGMGRRDLVARDESIDIAKGIGMILVISAHCGIGRIDTFYMGFFFLLSGYFLSSKLSIGAFVKKRARQLLIPYCLGVLITILGSIIKDICLGRWGG